MFVIAKFNDISTNQFSVLYVYFVVDSSIALDSLMFLVWVSYSENSARHGRNQIVFLLEISSVVLFLLWIGLSLYQPSAVGKLLFCFPAPIHKEVDTKTLHTKRFKSSSKNKRFSPCPNKARKLPITFFPKEQFWLGA